ncbi:hypothetical protein HYR99_01385, partial [Candidatus Poribacteria bacterium]|nr:hypothetical protein [Candidatus Poribacteria bacterium]
MLSKIGIIGLITVLILLAFLGCGEEQNPVSGSGNSQSSFKDSMAKAKIGSFAEIKQQSLQQQYVSLQQIMDKYPILDKFFHSIENVKGNGQSSDIYRDLPTKELIMSEVNKAGGYDKYLIALSQLELTHGTANDKANWAQNHGVYAAPSATTQAENPWDVNKDQVVNILDLVEVARHFGEKIEGESPPYDINKDGVVNILDLVLVGTHFGEKYQAQWVQPATGPGGRDYRYAEVTKQVYNEGTGEEYWIFEPASPTPASAPLILFNHGWGALKPDVYGAWIKHLVRRGNIVVYPRYQEDLLTSMKEFTPNALAAVKAALIELQKGPHVRPELNHFAIVGHSIGGALTASLAALAASEGLP